MLIPIKGNMLESDCQTITAPVNCVGAMGAGLALQIKKTYPTVNPFYRFQCSVGRLVPGKPMIYNAITPQILLFPTKNHWKDPSRIEWVEYGLDYIVNNYKRFGITSLAIPPLGCGLGGLNWIDVNALIQKHMSKLDIKVEIYIP